MTRAALLDMELRYVADDGVVVVTTLGQVDEARLAGGRPVRLPRSRAGQRHKGAMLRPHVPDFLLHRRDGGALVVDVKPAQFLDVPEIAELLAWNGLVLLSPPGSGAAPRDPASSLGPRSGAGVMVVV